MADFRPGHALRLLRETWDLTLRRLLLWSLMLCLGMACFVALEAGLRALWPGQLVGSAAAVIGAGLVFGLFHVVSTFVDGRLGLAHMQILALRAQGEVQAGPTQPGSYREIRQLAGDMSRIRTATGDMFRLVQGLQAYLPAAAQKVPALARLWTRGLALPVARLVQMRTVASTAAHVSDGATPALRLEPKVARDMIVCSADQTRDLVAALAWPAALAWLVLAGLTVLLAPLAYAVAAIVPGADGLGAAALLLAVIWALRSGPMAVLGDAVLAASDMLRGPMAANPDWTVRLDRSSAAFHALGADREAGGRAMPLSPAGLSGDSGPPPA